MTEAVSSPVDPEHFAHIASLTVGELRERILQPDFPAACAKVMSNLDLMVAAAPLRKPTRCRTTMGEPGVLGVRIQPNHPTDSLSGILLSVVDGLSNIHRAGIPTTKAARRILALVDRLVSAGRSGVGIKERPALDG